MLRALIFISLLTGGSLLPAATAADVWPQIAPFFKPPAEFAGKLGAFKSPLKFYDGHEVISPADWPRRRAEILRYWHEQMGPGPDLIARPKVEVVSRRMRGDLTELRVQLEVAPGAMQHGFLLLPPGDGPKPAVLVVFYAPEVSVAYDGPEPLTGQAKKFLAGNHGENRDFGLQLSRRGFVTLSIGTPGDNAYQPDLYGMKCQPLSQLAYIAANCHTVLAQRPEVDPQRIGVMGHSYGGKWAMFASCLYEKFACAVWSDGGVVFDEARPAVNYWEPWYLGLDPSRARKRGLLTPENPRTGAYRRIVEGGHDLVELHALMAPRPFLVSGGSEDRPERWLALNQAVAVNRFLGFENRVAFTSRPAHSPTPESNEQAFLFLEHFLRPSHAK